MKKVNYDEKANRFFLELKKNQIIDAETETEHLLSNPKNANRIAAALDEFKQGKGQEKKLNG